MRSKKKLLNLLVVFLLALSFIMTPVLNGSFAETESVVKKTRLNVETSALVFQTDFGVKNDAVASMKGVAFGVNPKLKMFDLTHDIEPYNIWEGAYWLSGVAEYWPEGTVFVSVIDPGVGTDRKSVVLKTETGQYFVTPDNGTLTLVAEKYGIEEVREIDEAVNRLKDSEKSYTFHGRDVYAYTGARLASGAITFEEVGKELQKEVVTIEYQKPEIRENAIHGIMTVIDQPYGNMWTSIPRELFDEYGVKVGDELTVRITHEDQIVYEKKIPYVNTFGDVEEGKDLIYMNSELKAAFAINMGNFSEEYGVYSGFEWVLSISK
ncbi:S-adenosyl-l-methionine hydroxide adenosyltransferase family protein [Tissierella sp. Yu-01]|uniref:SAM hydrolase/SAM-dependent halogenase family protein n=1 Tax=Tissierella sp. Yu-01 TaxID=3035694 RepID=UPI00240DCCA4|nr:S-adenosyl-l-methionine hydroxide adenosyltransferase family protein [Tissierella sp. Yu-01]WFA07799.1 S-adenosyl-l-methionine hydroxide adenosyltransferase family protein [Tissierella sp. Yu-01]